MSEKVKVYAVAVRDTLALPGTGDPPFSIGTPHPQAADYLRSLKAIGATVIVHDPAANTLFGFQLLVMWLRDNGIDAYDSVWDQPGKPAADVYVDNRSEKWNEPTPSTK